MRSDLVVEDLAVFGRNGRRILTVDHLVVESGQSLGVSGPSGAGKSTFLFAIAGLVENSQGRVLWGGQDILDMSTRRRGAFRAQNVGFVFQDFLLFEELNGLDNAALAALFAPARSRGAIRTRAAAALEKFGLKDTQRNVASFSGGERQRVGVARALANDPPFLLADEPTASLHREAADALIDALTSVSAEQGKTLITVSHDPALLRRMDRVVTLVDGAMQTECAP